MGNCNLKSEEESSSMSSKSFYLHAHPLLFSALNKSLFEYKYAIGRGGFGKVWRVTTNRLKGENNTQFAMKEMLKARVMHKKSIQSVMNELKLLSMISSKFIVNAHYAF
jgi:serine/threonine protein kinase